MTKVKNKSFIIGMAVASYFAGSNLVRAQGDQWIATGNQADSTYEVYDPAVTDWNSSSALKWSFTPTVAGGWTSAEIAAYSNPSDLKLRMSGNNEVVVSCASGGLATIGTYPGGDMLWALNVGGSYNPHSVELLPNGNIAVAASDGNFVRVYASSQSDSDSTYAQFNLTGAHACLWDPVNNVLWVLGTTELTALSVGGTAASPTLSEVTSREVTLPGSGGHEMSPVWGDPDRLWVTVSLNVYIYQKSTKTFSGAPGSANRTAVKGCGNQPSGEIVQCQQDNSVCTMDTWCTPNINFFTASGATDYTRTKTGAAFYKCRIFTPAYQPNLFAFAGPIQTDNPGEMEIFGTDTNGAVWHDWQVSPSSGWNSWADLGSGAYPGIAVGRNNNGALEIFAVSTNDDNVWHNWQNGPDGTWGGWFSLGGMGISNLVAACNANGCLQVFGIGTNTDIWTICQTTPSGGWSAWTDMGGAGIHPGLVVDKNGNGTLELFGVGSGGNVYNNIELTLSGSSWAGWTNMGGNGINPRLAVGRNSDSRLQVFGVGTNTDIWTSWQNAPEGTWSAWTDMNVSAQPGFVVGQNLNGCMEIAATTGGSPVHIWQTAASSSWTTNWLSLGSSPPTSINSQLMVGNNSDGRLQVFGKGTNGDAWTTWQNAPSGTWSAWTDMGGPIIKFFAGQ